MNNLIALGRFLSLVLRHHPEAINLKLDNHGWIEVAKLIKGVNDTGRFLDQTLLDKIVTTDNKQRYQYNEDHTKIRAVQGHSINVDVELEEKTPPDILYHGTAKHKLVKIKQSGIKKMQRLYVHLSSDVKTAKQVGSRYGKPIVLVIDSKAMGRDGYKFYLSANKVWLCDDIDYQYVVDVIFDDKGS